MAMFLIEIFLIGDLQTTVYPKDTYLSLSFSQDPNKSLWQQSLFSPSSFQILFVVTDWTLSQSFVKLCEKVYT